MGSWAAIFNVILAMTGARWRSSLRRPSRKRSQLSQNCEPHQVRLRGNVLRCGALCASLAMAITAAAAHRRRRSPLPSLACAAAVFGLDEESEFVTLDTYKSFLDETGRFTDWDAFRKLVFFRGLDSDVRPTLQLVQGRCRVIERPLWLVHVCG